MCVCIHKPYVLRESGRPVSDVTNSIENNLTEKLEVSELGKKQISLNFI